jgi:hypothetical protein
MVECIQILTLMFLLFSSEFFSSGTYHEGCCNLERGQRLLLGLF